MKKIFVAAALLVFGISNAQVSFKPGFKGGFSSSTVTGYGADYRNNFYLGAYGTLKMGKVYNMQFEMLYLRQGAANLQVVRYDNYNGSNIAIKATNVPLDYLSLNLINQFHFDKFSLHIGPGLDFKVSEESIPTYAEGSGVYYDNLVYTISNDVELSFNIGLGYITTDELGTVARRVQRVSI